MLGLSYCAYRAITRSDNDSLGRSNSETCAENAGSECRIRDIFLLYERSDYQGDDLIISDFDNDRLSSLVDCLRVSPR